VLIRVALPGRPAFQLRPGEMGISLFDTNGVEPELTEDEVLSAFRSDSCAVILSPLQIADCRLQITEVAGGPALPERMRTCHREIRPEPGMTRNEFKQALKRLAEHVD
jgi:hypothetical protein